MDTDQTLEWNLLGIIQGPEESDADFFKRGHYLASFKETIAKSLEMTEQDRLISDAVLREAFPKTRMFYDIAPAFVPVFFSNDKLPFWHGGSSWIVQLEKDSPTSALIQLRKAYSTKKRVFSYDKEEILVHELAHVGRMAYNCPRFEEILAWSSSTNRFRRFFGPLFTSLKETSLFAFLLITLFLVDIMTLFLGDEPLFQRLQLLKIIPLSYLLYIGIRLFYRQSVFSSCLSKLQRLLGSEVKARAVVYRLSDREIALFSKSSEEEINAYVKARSQDCLRWRTISKAYEMDALKKTPS